MDSNQVLRFLKLPLVELVELQSFEKMVNPKSEFGKIIFQTRWKYLFCCSCGMEGNSGYISESLFALKKVEGFTKI